MNRSGFTKIEFAVVLLLLTIPLGCLGYTPPAEFVFFVLCGWAPYLYRVLPQIRFDGEGVATFAGGVVLLCRGLHWFLAWLYSAMTERRSKSEQLPTEPSAMQPVWRVRWTLSVAGLVLVMFVAGISMVGIAHQFAWMLRGDEPIVNSGGEAWRRVSSANNLKQIGLGVHDHADTEGLLPAGGTMAPDGQMLHGWMTAILPYNEQTVLSEAIEHAKPWSDPVNKPSFATRVRSFEVPRASSEWHDAHGYALAGYAANQRLIGGTSARALADIPDGASSTILAGEAVANPKPWGSPTNWRDPGLGLNRSAEGFGGPWKSGTAMVFADGSIRFLNSDIDPAVLRALSTPAGGEPPPVDY